jgi:anaerobic glycerol-3-phosphate dehydrogenase C subunit
MHCSSEVIARHLRGKLDCPVLADPLTLALYSTDASIYQIRPACVVLPKSVEDVVACMKYAAEAGTPIAGRGGGSGLAGETLTRGIVLDFSRYLDRTIETDLDAGWVRCQPGLVLERLNAALAKIDRQFGPDPSSANRATIGGVIGNNATGAHSIKYGYTDAYIEELAVVLASGEVATFGPSGKHEPQSTQGGRIGKDRKGLDEPGARLAGAVGAIVEANQGLIQRHMPPVKRNRSGYALHKVIENGRLHLGRLIAGSEGTLALITEARLRFVERPAVRGLLQLNFSELEAMAWTVPEILTFRPSTCELMDGKLLEMARQAYAQYRKVLPGGVAASLVVEHDGASFDEVREKIDRTRRAVRSAVAAEEVLDPADQRAIWAARKAAVPLLFRRPGPKQPVPFIEDAAVPPDRLAEFFSAMDDIFKRHDVDVAIYGHAGDGEFHTRPYLDLHDPGDVTKMRSIAVETFRLAWSLGGTISGEHGVGLVRSEFLREQYGPLYDVMRQVKGLFDPQGILNPGKIIADERDLMTRHLRFAHRLRPDRLATPLLVWQDGSLVEEVERCNGNAECRSLETAGTMCPIFRATRDEVASPRAHANLLRHWITGQLDASFLYSGAFKHAVATCINCKTCHSQCPSGVNIPKLMLEARAQYVAGRGLTRTEWLLSHSQFMSALGAATAPLANRATGWRMFRTVLEWLSGIDCRRPMPRFASGSFVRKAQRILRGHRSSGEQIGRVAYFADLYANYHDHQLGWAVVEVLRHNNLEVVVPDQVSCQMPAMCYGNLESARVGAIRNLSKLAEAIRAGYTVVSSEPTATLCLREEYLDLTDSDDARLVAAHTQDVCEYLLGLHRKGHLKGDLYPLPMTVGYHTPCHLGALQIGRPGVELLRLIPELKVTIIEAGCCGLAGTYGFQRKNFDTSMAAGARLAEALRNDRFDAGTTECATCRMQMEFATGKPTWHPMVLLARAYGLTPFPREPRSHQEAFGPRRDGVC